MAVTEQEFELAAAEIQALVDFGTDFAKKMYAKHDSWIPFALTLTAGQRITMCAFVPSETEEPTTLEILQFARESLASTTEPALRAVAIVYEGLTRHADGTVKDPDAVMVEVDHCVAGARTIATPFARTRTWLGKRTMKFSADVTVTLGDVIAFPNPIGLRP